MNLLFNIKYRTAFGEQLVLNVFDKNGTTGQYAMQTNDGENWQCQFCRTMKAGEHINYYYSVVHDGVELRHEWLVAPHRLMPVAAKDAMCASYDYWIDVPDDSYLYSSAFDQCDNAAKMESKKCSSTIILKTRAPQLRAGERLALIGDDASLGNWEALKALPMYEQQSKEWMIILDANQFSRPLVEFKFVVLNDDNDVTLMWENGQNRTLIIPELKKGETVVYELEQAHFSIYPWKCAGTVIPVFSLRSEGSFGVGDFGDLKKMVDWAALTEQKAIQILPINDTNITHTWTDSYPYNSISIYALHPQYTDLRQLPELKDATRRNYYEQLRMELNALSQIDYERVNNAKMAYLGELFSQEWNKVKRTKAYKQFFEQNQEWLVPYAEFSVKRDEEYIRNVGVKECRSEGVQTLPSESSNSSTRQLVNSSTENNNSLTTPDFWYYVQFNLDTQMRAAHEYARSKQVLLKGDIPIGISRDGVEAWVEPRYFNMNGQAGAPPDAFSVNGQNWGFPTYNWDVMLEDGCSWWVRRFRKMAEYFDAYRIDHVLGFFRIWEIPIDAVHGLLGQFSPSLAMSPEEIESYGLKFQEEFFTKPFITDWVLERIFKEQADAVRNHFLVPTSDGRYAMKPEFDTQRKVEEYFKSVGVKECRSVGVQTSPSGATNSSTRQLANSSTETTNSSTCQLVNLSTEIKEGLYSLISNVLFVRDRKGGNVYHPRIGVQSDYIYETLYDCDKQAFDRLYVDYFYRRNNQFWYQEAMKKLPRLCEATRMLVCAEDLGMVPDCVPWVMNELRILSLEIQSMPKDPQVEFGRLSRNPYRSVCTISTHDMSTLRQWWDEDKERAQKYYNNVLHRGGGAPHPLPGWLAKEIVVRHLMCPSMLCLLSLQDWLSLDEQLRLPDANAERINIPANPRHYWRYRMHLTIEQLLEAKDFNNEMRDMIRLSGR